MILEYNVKCEKGFNMIMTYKKKTTIYFLCIDKSDSKYKKIKFFPGTQNSDRCVTT